MRAPFLPSARRVSDHLSVCLRYSKAMEAVSVRLLTPQQLQNMKEDLAEEDVLEVPFPQRMWHSLL